MYTDDYLINNLVYFSCFYTYIPRECSSHIDNILIDTGAINNIPAYSPDYTVVYSANSSNVVLTMCDGQILYENGEFRYFDMEKLMHDMKQICADYFKPRS